MTKERLTYLRQESKAERLDLVEISEIENAFSKIPDAKLRDLRENATVTDMLDEIEANTNWTRVFEQVPGYRVARSSYPGNNNWLLWLADATTGREELKGEFRTKREANHAIPMHETTGQDRESYSDTQDRESYQT
jgi:hypothetical protein